MARIEFCPYCKSSQPEQPAEADGPEGFCQICGYPLRVEPTESAPFRPATILWIDDDQLLLSFCCEALNQHGYRTLVAADGPTGIETARTERPDLIILDVVMPNMDGFEACRELRKLEHTRDIPVIMVTTRGEGHHVENGFEVGCNDYVTKPINGPELLSKVRNLLGE